MNVITLLLSATSQGMLWSLLAIGVYMTFRILDIADLTAEGSFPLGGGIAAIGIVNGMHPAIATLLAFGGGMLAGLVTGILNTKFKIPALLAGIITMTGLYSVTSRVMGAPNIALLGEKTVFTGAQDLGLTKNNAVILVGLLIVLVVILLLVLFFRTEIGLAVRATGDNPDMSEANGIKNRKHEAVRLHDLKRKYRSFRCFIGTKQRLCRLKFRSWYNRYRSRFNHHRRSSAP